MEEQLLSLCMAPIRGVTDAAWRSSAQRLFGGFDDAVAPFVKPVEGQLKPGALLELGPEKNSVLPVIPQLLVNQSSAFITASKQLEQIGATCVNWNLGCPMPTSTRKKLGAGLLPHTDEIDRFLEAVFSKVTIKVSIKTRLGDIDPGDLDRLVPVFNRYPVCEVIIHPRVAAQRYEGPLNIDAFDRLSASLVHPVVYNGDICTVEDFERLQSRFPTIHRWMIGRGALFDPFLPGTIKNRGVLRGEARRKTLHLFHNELYAAAVADRSGFSHLHARMLQIWQYLSVAVCLRGSVEKELRKARSTAMYESIVQRIFNDSEK